MIELEEMLEGTPTDAEVSEFFRKGEWHEEHYLVKGIKRHLLTQKQRKDLFEVDVSIEELLNGRVAGARKQAVSDRIIKEWNTKLGFEAFVG